MSPLDPALPRPRRASVLAYSAGLRMMVVVPLLGVLWLAVAWAWGAP